jgi:HicB family
MQLNVYVEKITRQLAASADAATPEAQEIALRLALPLEASVRLALLEALSAAAEEITLELAPASVELRLRSGEPTFAVLGVVAGRSAGTSVAVQDSTPSESFPPVAADADEGASSRINLRLSDSLKTRVEAAAAKEGRSVNAWLVRAAAAALPQADRPRKEPPRGHRGPHRFTGWVQ